MIDQVGSHMANDLYNSVKPLGVVATLSMLTLFFNTPRFHMLAGLLWGLVTLVAIEMLHPAFIILSFVVMVYHAHMFRKRLNEIRTLNVCMGEGGGPHDTA